MFAYSLEKLIILISPIVPHIANELWEITGHKDIVEEQRWPAYDEKALQKDVVTVAITVNGKLRDAVEVEVDATKESVFEKAKQSQKVKRHIEGKNIKKVIFVKNKLINIVAV